MNKGKGWTGLLLATAVFVLGFIALYSNQKPTLDAATEHYQDGTALNLDASLTTEKFRTFLLQQDCFDDPADATCVADWILQHIKKDGPLPNLGILNAQQYKMPVLLADSLGGETLKARVASSMTTLGVTEQTRLMEQGEVPEKLKVPAGKGDATIVVKVMKPTERQQSGWDKLWSRLRHTDQEPVKGVPVRLTEHYYEKEVSNQGDTIVKGAAQRLLGYAVTDEQGVAQFHVTAGKFYSVLPVCHGYEYGSSKGTRKGALATGTTTYSFLQKEHRIAPLDHATYARLKADMSLTVRTPAEYKNALVTGVLMCIVAWWLAFLFVGWMDAKRGRESDRRLMVVLMTLTVLCVLTMFSIQHPLTDKLLGGTMALGVICGVVALCAVSSINFIRFYASQSKVQMGALHFDFVMQLLEWIAKTFPQKVNGLKIQPNQTPTLQRTLRYYLGLIVAVLMLPFEWLFAAARWLFGKVGVRSWNFPAGMGYLLIAVVLVILLRLFGTGPEGSDARVNLWFFQPSELSKYLVVFFVAAFFAVNAHRIQSFAAQMNRQTFRFQLNTIIGVVLVMGFLLSLYLILLSDMGPALVLMVTFIFLYSIARKDFGKMVLGFVTFAAMLLVGRYLNNTLLTLLAFAAVWLVLWIAVWWQRNHQIYESAIFLNLLVVAFIFGGELMSKAGISAGQRLLNRNAMAWSGVWENNVPGGDQVAQGIWSLASGGFGGQGVGQGNANLVPANHTDMVFTSIGETMGWIALVLVLVCLAVLLHRSLLLARRAGHPFAFYLASGIAIVTGVQFFVIVLGSIGLIPLTGVAVPFLSFGQSSLIVNLAAYGIVLSISRERATAMQQKNVRKYDTVVAVACSAFIGMAAVLAGVLFYYQVWARDTYLVKPAYVVNMNGACVQEYNPRIDLLMRQLRVGNIYDRNGLLLATSELDSVQLQQAEYIGLGVTQDELDLLKQKRLKRYYPLGDRLFFMLGDFNTRTYWSNNDANPYGYMAELRHLTELRGFDNVKRDDSQKAEHHVMHTDSYRESPFLEARSYSETFVCRDYALPELLAMLKGGMDSKPVREWNAKRPERDLTLTLDARLQVMLQNKMAETINANSTYKNNHLLRASVVVLDAQRGDLLCSANYPLPDQDTLSNHAGDRVFSLIQENPQQWIYTDRDLGLTYQSQPGSTAKVMSAMAGLMKFGENADTIAYTITNVDKEGVEGSGEPHGRINMEGAIVRSSNNYFINLVHDKNLYPQLTKVYGTVGARVDHPRMKKGEPLQAFTPYFFSREAFADTLPFTTEMRHLEELGLKRYNDYMTKERKHKLSQWNWWECGMAWGQGMLSATPLNMARVVSIVANDGQFVPTRYVLQQGVGEKANIMPVHQPVSLLTVPEAARLKTAMQKESDKHRRNGKNLPSGDHDRIGGKTGTPQHTLGDRHYQDAWYVFFVQPKNYPAPLAVALRIEFIGVKNSGVNSGRAVDFVANTILPTLIDAGYQIE